jgi:hypothetical protein
VSSCGPVEGDIRSIAGGIKMSERKIRPSGWIYVVAALIPLFGCLIAMAAAYR